MRQYENVRHLGFQPGGLFGFVTSRQTLASNVQPDSLRTPPQAPPQAPPQPQYPAAQMAQPSMTNPSMSQVGQPMYGAAPAVNAHGGPAMAGQIGTPGTGLDACIARNGFCTASLSIGKTPAQNLMHRRIQSLQLFSA